MTLNVSTETVTLALACLALGAKLLHQAVSHGRLVERVDVLYDFIFRRGKVEATQKGWGTFNSPFEITVQGINAILPFLSEFLPFYAGLMAKRPHLDPRRGPLGATAERELFFEFEKKFGDFILEKLCAPHQVSMGACIVSILKVCEENMARAAGGTNA